MIKKTGFYIIITALFIACDDQLVDSQNVSFKNQAWHINDAPQFNFTAPDTIQPYDLFLNLRNTHDYAYNNLWLISEIKFPQGKTITDTLQYQMANEYGAFLGDGSSDVYENKLWLKKGVRFRESGTYQLTLRHVTRNSNQVDGVNNLAGILDLGYSIEKQHDNGTD